MDAYLNTGFHTVFIWQSSGKERKDVYTRIVYNSFLCVCLCRLHLRNIIFRNPYKKRKSSQILNNTSTSKATTPQKLYKIHSLHSSM